MLKASVRDWTAFLPGAMDGLAEDLLTERSRGREFATPERPRDVPAGRWRRMSKLARATALVTRTLREENGYVPWESLPVVYGSAMGELVPTVAFLERLFKEGSDRVSPMNFQNSVYNATPGHSSLTFGLQGPLEVVSAGMATGLAALARGIEWLEHRPVVLVLVADGRCETSDAAHHGILAGEAVVGVLLEGGDDVWVADGQHGTPEFCRGRAYPYEKGFRPQLGRRVEKCIGSTCANGLIALLATRMLVLDQDDGYAISAGS